MRSDGAPGDRGSPRSSLSSRWSRSAVLAARAAAAQRVPAVDRRVVRRRRAAARDAGRPTISTGCGCRSTQMSPALVDAFLLKEDRWFYWHPGVNPVALARAAFRTYSRRRSPGRLDADDAAGATAVPAEHENAGGQAAPDRRCALWLEARYSKRESARGLSERRAVRRQHRGRRRGQPHLLRQVAGSRDARRSADAGRDSAASGRPRRPRRRRKPALLAARAQLGRLWLGACHGDDDGGPPAGRAADRRAARRFAMPWQAPHFVDARARRSGSAAAGRVDTTLDARPAARWSKRSPSATSTQHGETRHPQRRGAARGHARHGGEGVGRARPTTGTPASTAR